MSEVIILYAHHLLSVHYYSNHDSFFLLLRIMMIDDVDGLDCRLVNTHIIVYYKITWKIPLRTAHIRMYEDEVRVCVSDEAVVASLVRY